MFTLTIETDNEAFSERNKRHKLAHILRRVAERVEEGETQGKVMGVKGNSVGYWEVVG